MIKVLSGDQGHTVFILYVSLLIMRKSQESIELVNYKHVASGQLAGTMLPYSISVCMCTMLSSMHKILFKH